LGLLEALATLPLACRRPPAIHLERSVRSLASSGAPSGGMKRLFLLGAARPETAALGIAGVDHRSAAAAVHQAGVAGQLEAALLLVRIVAGEALVLEERTDVVVVGQLLRILRGRGDGDEAGGQDEAAAREPAVGRRSGGHADGGDQWLK
jgi:hypothetical protein